MNINNNMKKGKINLEKFIISEINKISKEDKLNFHLKDDKQSIYECSCGCGTCGDKEDGTNTVFDKIEFEVVEPKEEFVEDFKEEIEEAKTISEELTRMKELLNFNNPLLIK